MSLVLCEFLYDAEQFFIQMTVLLDVKSCDLVELYFVF